MHDLHKREKLIGAILSALVDKDLGTLKQKWNAFEDATSTSTRAVVYAYQQTLSEMGLAQVLDVIVKTVDQPSPEDCADGEIAWACLMLCHYMMQLYPVVQRLWTMRDMFCPLLVKMLRHEHHVVRHSGIVACCQLMLGADQEQMLAGTKFGIVDFELLMQALRKPDVRYVSVLTFKHFFNEILRMYSMLNVRGERPVREYLWTTRIYELAEDLHARKKYGSYNRDDYKKLVDDRCVQLLGDISLAIGSQKYGPNNKFEAYPAELLIVQDPRKQDYPIHCSYPPCSNFESITLGNKTATFVKCDECRLAQYCSGDCRSEHWASGHECWCYRRGIDEEQQTPLCATSVATSVTTAPLASRATTVAALTPATLTTTVTATPITTIVTAALTTTATTITTPEIPLPSTTAVTTRATPPPPTTNITTAAQPTTVTTITTAATSPGTTPSTPTTKTTATTSITTTV